MRRRISLLLVPGLIAAGLFTGGPATAQTDPPAADPGPITVKAGYGEADATWHVGAGSGQYADKSPDNVFNLRDGDVDPQAHSIAQKDSYGVHSRLSYRAIVVEDAEGDHVAFVKSDSYLAQDYLLRRVGQILQLAESKVAYEEIFHMASHNHSSPYYMTPSAGVWVFQDVFDIRAFEYHARAMADAIMNAEDALKPARMGATTVEHNLFKGMIQRKGTADDGTPRGYPDDFGDLGLSIIRIDNMEDPTNPKPLATMINWGQHPEGLDGHDLITGDFVAPLERFVERATGAPLVFGQGDVGSAEGGPGRPDLVSALGITPRWSHAGHAQAERGAFLLARDVIEGYDQIADPTANPLVPFSSDFDVEAGNAWVAGPYSHPFPSVSNCRTETTVEGSPGAPGAPTCLRAGRPDPNNQLWEKLKEQGIYLPDNYPLPSYGGLEENTRLHLQAFKLGDVIVGSCACEAQVDLILNFESRANDVEGDFHNGFDWTTRMDCDQNLDTWTCNKKADEPRPNAVVGSFTTSNYRYQRMRAQVNNDAAGWDAPENIQAAMSEPHDPEDIFGNFTKEELTEESGYKLAIGVGHAGDYNGYTVSYREYQSWDDYRKSLTSYGPHTADYMVTRMVRLAGTLNGVPNEQLEEDIARGLPDEARQAAMSSALGALSFATYEAWINSFSNDKGPEAIRTQPEDIKRFDAATFSWVGGSNAVDNPVVKVQRQEEDGTWVDFADQSGEVQTRLDFPNGVNAFVDTFSGQQEWVWTANFEAFNAFPAEIGSTPEGEYRFVVDGLIRQGTPSTNKSYHLESGSFTVSGWDGVQISDLRVDQGTVSFVVPPIVYPESYESVFPEYISTVKSDGMCKQCSFRPWARSGEVEKATVTVTRADGTTEQIEARRGDDGRWYAATDLYVGDHAEVAPGGVVDNYGETNSRSSGTVEGDLERPPAEPEETVLSLTVSGKGANRVLTATLRELDSGTPISDREIRFYANLTLIGSARTSTGIATLTAPPGYRGDSFEFQAVFQGDEMYRASSSSAAT